MKRSRYRSLLTEIKNRIGRRTFDQYGGAKVLRVLIKRGLVAGPHSRAYLTDFGESFLESLNDFRRLRGIK